MTGHGEARRQRDGLAVSVEVRTVNSRYFKLALRANDGFLSLESRVEGEIRESIKRGTVQVNIQIDRRPSADDYRINSTAFASYRLQIQGLLQELGDRSELPASALLALPGVVDEEVANRTDEEAEWEVIREAVREALAGLEQMRRDEGRAMTENLRRNLRVILDQLDQIDSLAPRVVEAYRDRLHERLTKLLEPYQVPVQPADIVREIGMFAERCDISEEIVRLRSHLEQFDAILSQPESQGKKLEFLIQELFREANTIGSKANDAEIARSVVEMKTAVERMREMIQNVE